MGIHTGEPAVGGERYVGLGVHRAARICAAGHGGQILVSQTTRELLRDDPIADVSLLDLGEHRLKDMDESERLYQVVAPGLGRNFPSLKTAESTPFEGREGELAEAAAEEMAKRWRRPGRRMLFVATFAAAAVGAILGVLLTQGGGSTANASVSANAVGVIDSKGAIAAQIPVGVAPGGVAAGVDAIWVSNTGENTVSRIDPSTNDVRQTISVGGGPSGAAVTPDAVWVVNGLDATVSRIDTQTNQVSQVVAVGNGPTGAARERGEYIASLLRSIGFRADVKAITPRNGPGNYFKAVSDPRNRAQIGFGGWVADYSSAAGFIPPLLSCAAYTPTSPDMNSNLTGFCDPSIDAKMTRATALQATNPPAATLLWQQIERELLAQAPLLPTDNRRNSDFVSKRVGNYQYNPQWGVLLSQLWVR